MYPHLGRIQRELKDRGVQVVAINFLALYTLQQWRDYWVLHLGGEEVLWAQDTNYSAQTMGVTATGTSIIIDREGRVSYRHVGPATYKTFRAEVDKVL
ncbi:MAG: hypothetical protein HYX93_07285 [Chloroflexi bacterium]|nr:hypothetical protein [Chloroflexota bacterium]